MQNLQDKFSSKYFRTTLFIFRSVACVLNFDNFFDIKSVAKRHEKKLSNFRKRQQKSDIKSGIQASKNTIRNFSSYSLSDDEIMVLDHGLDQHIPGTVNCNSINTESELFY